MARLVTYECPDCGGRFEFMHHPSSEPPPDHCHLCQASFSDPPERAIPERVNIGSEIQKVPDRLYRQMEAGSEQRAHMAAELTGDHVSEMSNLKITNMSDNAREGEHSAITNASAAEARLSTATARPTLQGRTKEERQAQATAYAEQTTAGPHALAGRKFIEATKDRGKVMERMITRAGNDGKNY